MHQNSWAALADGMIVMHVVRLARNMYNDRQTVDQWVCYDMYMMDKPDEQSMNENVS